MEYPDGYLEAQAAKKQSKEAEADGGAGSDEEAAKTPRLVVPLPRRASNFGTS